MIQDSNVVAQSGIPQIPLVNSTQILTQSSPLVNSQMPAASTQINTTQVTTAPTTSQQISYVPIVSAIQQPKTGAKPVVKVVPIYDEM